MGCSMRIIAGKFGGRRLSSFQAEHLRPTTDRIKESIFNSLAAEIEGARVLDLYAGTGNLGLEALSRGARQVVAIESSRKSIQIIRKNLALLQIEQNYELLERDVFRFTKDFIGEAFDLIFIDPPFTQKLADASMSAVAASRLFAPHTRIVIESSKHESLLSQYLSLQCYRQKDYGDKKLSFFQQGDV